MDTKMEDDAWFHRGVLVSNLPTSENITRDKLEIYFSRRSNGGGDVDTIVIMDDYNAIVIFKHVRTMNLVLAKSPHRLLDSLLNVTQYTKHVADTLRSTPTRRSGWGSCRSNGDIEDNSDDLDRYDGYELNEKATVDDCTCHDIFKIFEEVSVTIRLANLELYLPKTNTLNRISVRTGVKWEIDKYNETLLLSGKFNEVKNAAEMLQLYTNDKESIQFQKEAKKPILQLRSLTPNDILNGDRSPPPLRDNVPAHSCKLSTYNPQESSDDNIAGDLEEDGPDDNMAGDLEEDGPDDNMAGDLEEDGPDDDMAGDLEEDGPDDNDTGGISEDSEASSISSDLDQSSMEVAMQRNCLQENTAKIDVVCLDPKMVQYIMSKYKSQLEDIQAQFAVKFIHTDKGQITLEIKRDDCMTENAKRAIQDVHVMVNNIKTQDPQHKNVNLKNFNFTDSELTRICQEAEQSNPEITAMLLEDARIQLYGAKIMVENAVKWFGKNVVTPALAGRKQHKEPEKDEQHDARHNTAIDKDDLENVAPKKKPLKKTMPSNTYIKDHPGTANGHMLLNKVKISDATIMCPRKEETNLVKSVCDTLGEKESVIGRRSPSRKKASCTEKFTTSSMPPRSSPAKASVMPKPTSNSGSRTTSSRALPTTSRQFAEAAFAQRTLDVIQAIHYEEINKLVNKYEVRFEQKSGGKIEIHPQKTNCNSKEEILQAAMDDFKALVESVGENLVTKTIDLNILDVPQKNIDESIRDAQQNAKVLIVVGSGRRIEFVGTAEEIDIAVEYFTTSAKSETPTTMCPLENDTTKTGPPSKGNDQSISTGSLALTTARARSPTSNSNDISDQRPCTPPQSPPPSQVVRATFDKKVLDFLRVAHYKDINALSITYGVNYEFNSGEVEIRPEIASPNTSIDEKLQLAMGRLTTLIESVIGKLVTKTIELKEISREERANKIRDVRQIKKVLIIEGPECQIEIYGTPEQVQIALDIIEAPTELEAPTTPPVLSKAIAKANLTSQGRRQLSSSASLQPSTMSRSRSHLSSSELNTKTPPPPPKRQIVEETFDQQILDFIQAVHYKDIDSFRKSYGVEFEMKGNGNVAIRPQVSTDSARIDMAMSSLKKLVKSLGEQLLSIVIDSGDFDVPWKNVDVAVAHAKENKNILVTDGPGRRIKLYGKAEQVRTARETLIKHVKVGETDSTLSRSARSVKKQNTRAHAVATSCTFETTSSRSKKSDQKEKPSVHSARESNQNLIPRGISASQPVICDTARADTYDFQEDRKRQANGQFCVPKSASVTTWSPGSAAFVNADDTWEDEDYEVGHSVNDMRMYGDLDDPSASEVAQHVDQHDDGLGDHWYEGDFKSVIPNMRSTTNPDFDQAGALGFEFEDDNDASTDLMHDIANFGELDSEPYDTSAAASAASLGFWPQEDAVSSRKDTLILNTSAGFDIEIRQGDITSEFVSIIVSSADPHLGNQTAVARAIKQKAGPELARACREWVERRGTVDVMRPVYTDAGNLACNRVLHVVSPTLDQVPIRRDRRQTPVSEMLHSILSTCLRMPETKSLAMPAIGIDSLQMSKQAYARALFDAIVDFIQSPPPRHQKASSELEKLIIVDQNASLVDTLKSVFASRSSDPICAHLFWPRLDGDDEVTSADNTQSFQRMNTGARPKSRSDRRHNTSHRKRQNRFTQNRPDLNQHGNGTGNVAANFSHGSEDDDIMTGVMAHTSLVSKKLPKVDDDDDKSSEADDNCPICLGPLSKSSRKLKCTHTFCQTCLDQSIKHNGQTCPVCKKPFGKGKRAQTMPTGKMDVAFDASTRIPGYPDAKGTIIITYTFTSGTQGDLHPHPGRSYRGTSRTAYLPDTEEGRAILNLLKRAFDKKLTFTIGRSSSSGQEDVIIWNDIHHKTSVAGGSSNHGYPDPTYLARVGQELEDKGIR